MAIEASEWATVAFERASEAALITAEFSMRWLGIVRDSESGEVSFKALAPGITRANDPERLHDMATTYRRAASILLEVAQDAERRIIELREGVI